MLARKPGSHVLTLSLSVVMRMAFGMILAVFSCVILVTFGMLMATCESKILHIVRWCREIALGADSQDDAERLPHDALAISALQTPVQLQLLLSNKAASYCCGSASTMYPRPFGVEAKQDKSTLPSRPRFLVGFLASGTS